MDIVIIGHNEGNSIINMFNSIKHINGNRIWVLDRCTDNSESLLIDLNETYIKTPGNLIGRQTSFSRNLGLKYTNKISDVLFLDGDRYITSGNLNNLTNSEYDIELLMVEEDNRKNQSDISKYGEVFNGFYSCGVFFKRHAINKVLEFQHGEFFREDIQDVWGIEDTYLGDVCYHLGLTCNLNKDISLYGKFDKNSLDSLDVLEKRFRLRDKLNVNWGV